MFETNEKQLADDITFEGVLVKGNHPRVYNTSIIPSDNWQDGWNEW